MQISGYVKSTPCKGILFSKSSHLKVEVYTYVDWARSTDDMHLASGNLTFVAGNLVAWRIEKHNVVARSSAEAKYRVVL